MNPTPPVQSNLVPAAQSSSVAGVEAAKPSVAPPAGGVVYKVDSSHASFAELWRDVRSPSILVVWITKLLGVRLPGSVNDPNVESLRPFEVRYSSLPADVRGQMEPKLREFHTLGFDLRKPIAHVVVDLFNNSRLYMTTVPRMDGKAVARVMLRREGAVVPPKTHFHSDILSERTDGGFLWTSGAKAVLNAPKGVVVQSSVEATPSQLWTLHEKGIGETGVGTMDGSRTAAREMMDRHHISVRDFHLRRKVFVPMSELDANAAASITDSYNQGTEQGSAHPEIFAEMERLQTKQSGWLSGAIILGISLLLFVAVGVTGGSSSGDKPKRDWEWLLLLIPILFFHELGHYVAMRLFRYRNVRMFFIPGFGAAVSGHSYGAPGWKKVIVSLMGPLPGILVGGVIGVVGIVLHHAMLMKIAVMALILNGFNLIPVPPLDGGRVAQSLLFSRHYALDVAFRALAGATLVAMGLWSRETPLTVLGIFMLIGLPMAWRLGRVASEIRRNGFQPPANQQEKISPSLSNAIIGRLVETLPSNSKKNNKLVAQHALTVYEQVCSRPPGWAATIGFGLLHGGALVVSIVLALAVMIGQGGRFGDLIRAAARQPTHVVTPADVTLAQGQTPATAPADEARLTVVANFAKSDAAKAAFESLQPRLGTGQSLERFGQTLMASVPAADDAGRRQWLEAMEGLTKEVAVESPDSLGFGLTLWCQAPGPDVAAQIEEELNDYLQTTSGLNLIAPWSPTVAAESSEGRERRKARHTYRVVQSAQSGIYKDARLKAQRQKIAAATHRHDTIEIKRLEAENVKLIKELRVEAVEKVKGTAGEKLDIVVLEQMAKLPEYGDEDPDEAEVSDASPKNVFESPAYQAMADRMGRLPLADGKLTGPDRRYAAYYGSASHEGRRIMIPYIRFVDTPAGAAALLHWLVDKGCDKMKYDIRLPSEGASSLD